MKETVISIWVLSKSSKAQSKSSQVKSRKGKCHNCNVVSWSNAELLFFMSSRAREVTHTYNTLHLMLSCVYENKIELKKKSYVTNVKFIKNIGGEEELVFQRYFVIFKKYDYVEKKRERKLEFSTSRILVVGVFLHFLIILLLRKFSSDLMKWTFEAASSVVLQ